MEQHPIPQDITGFKFKLVGDMTLQQFGYIAVGDILAYASFASGFPFIIKWPLVFLFGVSGFALAFLPVEERPLDRWIISFVKLIYSPTQYLWQKKANLPEYFQTSYAKAKDIPQTLITSFNGSRQNLADYLKTLPSNASTKIDLAEQTFLQNVMAISSGKSPRLPTAPINQTSIPKSLPIEIEQKQVDQKPGPDRGFAIVGGKIVRQTVANPPSPVMPKKPAGPSVIQEKPVQDEILKKEVLDLKEEMGKLQHSSVFTVNDLNKLKSMAQQLSEMEKQKSLAQNEILRLKQELSKIKETGVRPVIEEEKIPQARRVKFVPGNQAKRAGLPNPPQTPNIVSGLVIDQKEEILPGVIIVIKDNQDNPVRAIKTNKLGQFSISTPLPNGIYLLELEKEGYEFDIIELEAKGEIILPIEVKAK